MKQLWVALLILPIVLAASIETSETTLDVEKNNIIVYTSMMLTPQKDIGNLTFILAQNAKDVEVTIDGEKRDCTLVKEFARCGSMANGTHTANITYETSYPIAESGENTLIRYTDRLPYPAEKQQVSIKLPLGYIVPREKDKDEDFYVTPKTTDTYSDGQRVILYWEQKGQELPISVVARQVVRTPIGWMAAALIAIAAAIISSYIVIHQRRTTKPKQKKKTTIVPTLIDNEQKIVNFLKENGEVWQKQIQQATTFSKAKVSRILRNLEERGVITKTIYGNTNKIALKK
ncbi:MAG: winged helix-turn-helix transcriptional regulator [Candidatus Woesearchaeota archaeon]|nr:winged helix-turn-helix transcriptional regulator [Candidatus Woesearchaeota archaeon]